MTKFYVLSGSLRLVVMAVSARSAAVSLVSKADSKPMGEFIYVGERGFGDYEGLDPEGFLFLTEKIEAESCLE